MASPKSPGKIHGWWEAHGGAVLAFAGAAGALATAVIPGADAALPWVREAAAVVGIVGAVLHAYLRTPQGGG